MKRLVITADDFGMSHIFNQEIISLCEEGKLSAVSVMVKRGIENQYEDVNALKTACMDKNIGIWLHLDFKWDWNSLEMIQEQLKIFTHIFSMNPDHIDVHKEIANEESERYIVDMANHLKIPLRNRWNLLAERHTDGVRYIGSWQSTQQVEQWLTSLEDSKSYEIVFHPGIYDAACDSSLNADREKDIVMIHHIRTLFAKFQIDVVSTKTI